MMTRAQTAALAEEIQQSLPTPEWDSVTELKKFRSPIELKGGEKKNLKFDELVVLYRTIKSEIDFREKRLKEIKEAVTAAMDVSGEEHVLCEGHPVDVIVKSGSKKISAEKLLSKGVSAFTIAECTLVSDEIRYVQIGKAKRERD
jgi:hypothetical protein